MIVLHVMWNIHKALKISHRRTNLLFRKTKENDSYLSARKVESFIIIHSLNEQCFECSLYSVWVSLGSCKRLSDISGWSLNGRANKRGHIWVNLWSNMESKSIGAKQKIAGTQVQKRTDLKHQWILISYEMKPKHLNIEFKAFPTYLSRCFSYSSMPRFWTVLIPLWFSTYIM